MPVVIYSLPIRSYQIGGLTVFGPSVVRLPGPPVVNCLGYFHGCPTPQLPVCRVPMPILRNVAARCCVTPPFLPLNRWFVTPPARFLYPPVLVFRR